MPHRISDEPQLRTPDPEEPVNGLPVATAELKTDFTQSVADAIVQYRTTRLPKDPRSRAVQPLFLAELIAGRVTISSESRISTPAADRRCRRRAARHRPTPSSAKRSRNSNVPMLASGGTSTLDFPQRASVGPNLSSYCSADSMSRRRSRSSS